MMRGFASPVQIAAIFCAIVAILAPLVTAGTSRSYQYVRFVSRPHYKVPPRPTRSHQFSPEIFELPDEVWPESLFLDNQDNHLFDVTLGHQHTITHYTPDYSNGLEYPDPLLLTGHEAKHAINYLYGKGELFYSKIPHVRAILRLQEIRKEQGMPPNRLGSLRPNSPFYRDSLHHHSNFFK